MVQGDSPIGRGERRRHDRDCLPFRSSIRRSTRKIHIGKGTQARSDAAGDWQETARRWKIAGNCFGVISFSGVGFASDSCVRAAAGRLAKSSAFCLEGSFVVSRNNLCLVRFWRLDGDKRFLNCEIREARWRTGTRIIRNMQRN